MEPILPQTSDYRGSRLALVRLQMTYQLSIKDLLNGIVAGYKAPPLSQRHSLAIGLTAAEFNYPNQSIVWLNAALKHEQPPRVKDSEIYHALAKAYALVRSTFYMKIVNCRWPYFCRSRSCISLKLI